jgi:hypothetical protein
MSVLDSLDELLYDLPSEPLPLDLVERIQADIATYRKRRRRIVACFRTIHSAMALTGVGLILPRMEELLGLIPSVSTHKLGNWLSLAVESPNDASLELISSLERWGTSCIENIEAAAILALLLLAFAGFLELRQILRRTETQEGVLV